MTESITFRKLGLTDYQTSYKAMSAFTAQRQVGTKDEVWSLQHPSVYTLGLAGKQDHILDAGQIPVVKTDRGGQVTYHGPGQLIMYLLLNLRCRKIGIKDYVYLLEKALIDYLAEAGLSAKRKRGAPGVYIEDCKIAALGIRVRRGCCYHGLSLNVNMDIKPFRGINPCGYPQLEVVQLADFGLTPEMDEVADSLLKHLLSNIISEPYNVIIKQDLADLLPDYTAT
jgi:lipoyl(octanoyl) transferase